MSHDEYHSGTLRKLYCTDNMTVEEHAKFICGQNGWTDKTYDDESWVEHLMDEGYDEYLIVKDDIYKIENHVCSDDHYGTTLHMNEDGTIGFTSSFYNGGTCLSEMLEDALEELERK